MFKQAPTYLAIALTSLAAHPALAHQGDHAHLHPHGGESWFAIVAALFVVAAAVGAYFYTGGPRK